MNTKIKGDIGELLVAADLMQKGWVVSFPVGENNRYDIVAEKNNIIKRIQVKAIMARKGALIVNCRSSNNWSVIHYTSKDFEILAAVDLETKQIYYIPSNKMRKNAINLRLIAAKNNQSKKINLAKNFLTI